MKLNKYHIYYWLLYSMAVISIDFFSLGAGFHILRELVMLTIQVWIFYSFLFVLVHAHKKKPAYFIIFLLFICSFATTFFFNYLRSLVARHYGVTIFEDSNDFISNSIGIFIQFSFSATGFFYAFRYGMKQRELRELEKKNAENEKLKASLEFNYANLQKELVQSENNFLRAQINPHFLYNCLNFIYSKTFQQDPKIAEVIMMLSQVMRYSLTDFSTNNGMANLEEEISHIENVININKFRFGHSLQVQFVVKGSPVCKMIAPMLLITLVENVFKHGDLQDQDFPANLECRINETDKTVQFTTCNKINKMPLTAGSGVGLSNIKQRLKLLYNNDFTLTHQVKNDAFFEVQLVIPYFETFIQ